MVSRIHKRIFTRKNKRTILFLLVIVFCTRSGLATENPKIAPSKSFQHRFNKCAKAIQMEEAVFPIFSNKECWRNWLSRPSLRVSHWQKDVWIKSFSMSARISHLLAYRMGISQWQKEVRPGMEREPVIWLT